VPRFFWRYPTFGIQSRQVALSDVALLFCEARDKFFAEYKKFWFRSVDCLYTHAPSQAPLLWITRLQKSTVSWPHSEAGLSPHLSIRHVRKQCCSTAGLQLCAARPAGRPGPRRQNVPRRLRSLQRAPPGRTLPPVQQENSRVSKQSCLLTPARVYPGAVTSWRPPRRLGARVPAIFSSWDRGCSEASSVKDGSM
jgi:hypothetical protein